MVENFAEKQSLIAKLKEEKGVVIFAHYYCRPEVQQVADFLGDSLALSIKAREVESQTILFAGVHFMGETAKVLSPEKRVLIPNPLATCSLAESCPAEEFGCFVKQYPEATVISYVNTTVGVKALTDICCTSSNALQVVESVPRDKSIIFGPDRNLGSYIKKITGRDNMILWDGACHVHEKFSKEGILALKGHYPAAKVVVHPECRGEVADLADYCGSTAGILDYCGKSESDTFIVVTEPGILAEMERLYPNKHFVAAPSVEGKECNECEYMKMITLDSIIECLEKEAPEIEIEEQTRQEAERSIEAMVKIK